MKLIQMHRAIVNRYQWYWDKNGDELPKMYPIAPLRDKVRLAAWHKWRYR